MSKAARAVDKSDNVGDSKLQSMLKALAPQEPGEVDLSADQLKEAERRAKEYSRLKMQQHREWQADLTTKLKLKLAAIEALPPNLRAAALVPDLEPFPSNRQIWTETPPSEEPSGAAQQAPVGTTKRRIGTKKR